MNKFDWGQANPDWIQRNYELEITGIDKSQILDVWVDYAKKKIVFNLSEFKNEHTIQDWAEAANKSMNDIEIKLTAGQITKFKGLKLVQHEVYYKNDQWQNYNINKIGVEYTKIER